MRLKIRGNYGKRRELKISFYLITLFRMKLILRISKTNYFYDSKNITSTIARTINKLTRDKRVQNLEDTFQISEHNYDSKYFNFELSFIDNKKKIQNLLLTKQSICVK